MNEWPKEVSDIQSQLISVGAMLQSPGEFITFSPTSQKISIFAWFLALFDGFFFCAYVFILSNERLPCYCTKLTKACLAIQNVSIHKAHVWLLLNPEGSLLAKVDYSTKRWEHLGVSLKEHLVKHYYYKDVDATVAAGQLGALMRPN